MAKYFKIIGYDDRTQADYDFTDRTPRSIGCFACAEPHIQASRSEFQFPERVCSVTLSD
jgi:hypothetical protein